MEVPNQCVCFGHLSFFFLLKIWHDTQNEKNVPFLLVTLKNPVVGQEKTDGNRQVAR